MSTQRHPRSGQNDAVRVLTIVGAVGATAYAVFSAVQSHYVGAAVWGLMALIVTWSAFRPPRTVNGPQDVTLGMRVYSIGVCVVLLVGTVALIVAAVAAEPDDRGFYIGLAVLVGSAALALSALAVAIERKLRNWRRAESEPAS